MTRDDDGTIHLSTTEAALLVLTRVRDAGGVCAIDADGRLTYDLRACVFPVGGCDQPTIRMMLEQYRPAIETAAWARQQTIQ